MQANLSLYDHQNETGSLWVWTQPVPQVFKKPRPLNLWTEARPLFIRLAILVSVVGFATLVPHHLPTSAPVPLIQTTDGLKVSAQVQMAQLILDPVATSDVLQHADGRTSRHPVAEFHFTRFSNSWIDFQF